MNKSSLKKKESDKGRSAISPTRAEDYSAWYQSVVREADMAEMSHVRGCMVIKPWGYGIWENIKAELDRRIKATGHENAYFPLFIPLSYLESEAEHVEGFAKEMAVVTHHRLEFHAGKLRPAGKLEMPLVVRPTSETIIGDSFSRWIQSYRDLPIKMNQWANVVRWEMRPRVFLRTTEFLWQEGHTAHATEREALAETMTMFEVYRSFAEEFLALPVIAGEKPPSERFPGAVQSFAIEAMMQDGKALQSGTSHYLGQNFARAAQIKYLDENGEQQYVYTTSWGVSTRLIGAVVMAHGDDNGLRVPPKIAPCHIVVVPILRKGAEVNEAVSGYCRELAAKLSGCSFSGGQAVIARLDDRQFRPVEKKWQWVKKGAPIILEIGPRDMKDDAVSALLRTHDPKDYTTMSRTAFLDRVGGMLDDIQEQYYRQAKVLLDANLHTDIDTFDDLRQYLTNSDCITGFVRAKWDGTEQSESKLKDMAVTIRCLPLDQTGTEGKCVLSGRPATIDAIFARSY